MNLTNCRAQVTGGSGGLGPCVLNALAVAGVDIAIAYNRGREKAENAAKLVQAAGRTAHCVQLDLTGERAVRKVCILACGMASCDQTLLTERQGDIA